MQDFLDADGVYLRTDSDGKKLFMQVLEELGLWFRWSSERQNKFPDVAVRLNGRLSVIEHKHMKEGGGGQDKQIGELIDFIRQNDPQVSYISFLDGVYFNELAVADQSERKSRAQLNQIRQALRANRYNYFVNTAGFLHWLSLNGKST